MNKIPKKIHYCWFGRNPLNEMAVKCIESWKKYLPDYEIIEWNEDTFDVSSVKFTREAYKEKKWAFVSDYVRLWALYNEGGIYMDTDIEVIKSYNELLENDAFGGFENRNLVTTGVIGAKSKSLWIKELLDSYSNQSFYDSEGNMKLVPNTRIVTDISTKLGLKLNGKSQVFYDNVKIYEKDYFAPKSALTNKLEKTENTYCIHHFSGSWMDGVPEDMNKFKLKIIETLGEDNYLYLAYKKDKVTKLLKNK